MLLAVSSYGKFTLFLFFTFVAHHAVFQYCLFKYVSSAVALAVLLTLLVVRNCSTQQLKPKTFICALKAVSYSPVASAHCFYHMKT